MEKLTHLSDKANEDYSLVEKAKQGDQQAYTEIMNRYRDPVYYMLLKMVRTDEDAEDLTIEAFSKAFNKIDTYTPDFAFSTWIFKIASNNAIDFLRKKRAKTVSLDSGYTSDEGDNYYFEIASKGLNPEENTIKSQKHKILHEFVNKLKPRYRKLIELRFFKEYSYEELSEELDLPMGTIKAQLHRAKHLLNEVMQSQKDKM